jgi:hypothetical protein
VCVVTRGGLPTCVDRLLRLRAKGHTLRGALRPGGTVGPGTRCERKPVTRTIVLRAYEQGVEGMAWSFGPGLLKPAKRITAPLLADVLVAELEYLEYSAREYDPDLLDRDERESERFLKTEQSSRKRRSTVARAHRWPGGNTLLGEVDGELRWRHVRFAEQAEALRQELGHRFVTSDRHYRAAMVRNWIRNWREQGRFATPRDLSEMLNRTSS